MQKYIELLNMPNWVPFFGMMTAVKTPFATRLMESAIQAFVLLAVGAMWMIPAIKTELHAGSELQKVTMTAYAENLKSLTSEVRKGRESSNSLKVAVAVMENNISRIEEKVDSISDIANTKVKSIEGRLGVIEFQLKK